MPQPVNFYPLNQAEHHPCQMQGIRPKHVAYSCGSCGKPTNGRIVADVKREGDGATVSWVLCACPKEEAVILIERGGQLVEQFPEPREFQVGENWPAELGQLFEESAKAYSAGAYTASSMVSRKLLMVCACKEGATDGAAFTHYVSYITDSVLTFPKAKDAIDKIRTIGNEANHTMRFVSRDDAKRALSIVSYMLNAIYSLPMS